ncbi:organic solute transporter subunit alpha-like [Glandiceps talaboti]
MNISNISTSTQTSLIESTVEYTTTTTIDGISTVNETSTEPDPCLPDDPFTYTFYQEMSTWKIVILSLLTALTTITIGIFVEAMFFVQKNLPTKRRRAHVTWILGMYPIHSITSLLAIYVPRAHFIASIHASLYFSVTIYRFVILIFDYYGGFEAAVALLDGEETTIANPPLLCCCPCLPPFKLTRKLLLFMKRLAMQVALIRPMALLIAVVLWTDSKYLPGQITSNGAYVYLNTVSVISTLLAMYALVTIYKASKEPLRGFNISKKFMIVQLSLVLVNVQHPFLGILVSTEVIKCIDPINSQTRANILYNMLIVIEMFFISMLAVFVFRTRAGNMRHLISKPSLWLKQKGTEEQEMIQVTIAVPNNNVHTEGTIYERRASLFEYALTHAEVTKV